MSDLFNSVENTEELPQEEDGFGSNESQEDLSAQESDLNEDSGSEADASSESEAEAPPPRKPRKDIKAHISYLQQERHKALNENAQLHALLQEVNAEKEKYRQYFESSTQTAMSHYEDAALQRQQAALSEKKQAIEAGDVDAQATADLKLAQAVHEYQDVLKLKAQAQLEEQRNANQPPQEPAYIPPTQAQQQHATVSWLQQNPWMNPSSPNYDEELAQKVDNYAAQYAQELHRKGAGAWVKSPGYFQVINEYAAYEQNNRYNTPAPSRNLHLNKGPQTVTTPRVHGRETDARRQPNYPPLTGPERAVAELWGHTPQEYQKILHDWRRKEEANKNTIFGSRR